MTTEQETAAEKLARLRQEKAVRDKAQVDRRAEAEIESLELESKFSEGGARLGVDFAMVFDPDLGKEGVIVVKLGSDLAFRRYIDATVGATGLATAAEMFEFSAPAVVHPSPDAYAALVRTRGGLANRTCDALASLHRVRGSKLEGKF